MGSVPLPLMREAIARTKPQRVVFNYSQAGCDAILVASLGENCEQFEDDPDGKHSKLQPEGRYEIRTFHQARDQC